MSKKTSKVDKKVEKLDVLDFLHASIVADFGEESIMKMYEDGKKRNKRVYSYGWESLDSISGIGGVPKGRILEVYGPESSGKTTLTLHIAKQCQDAGGLVCFIDAEHALDIEYAKNLGVNIEEWMLVQPDFGEQAFQISNKLIIAKKKKEEKNKEVSEIPLLIIIDSVAALTPEAEIKGILDEGKGAGLGVHARMMSEGLRGLQSIMGKTNTNVIFINQTRSKIGGYGNPETTTGGNALKFYASVRIRISRTGSEKIGETIIGNLTKVKIVKNKLAPPFKECEGLIVFGEGIDPIWDIWTYLKSEKLIKKSGAWSEIPSISGIKKFTGYKQFKTIYQENKEAIDKLMEIE